MKENTKFGIAVDEIILDELFDNQKDAIKVMNAFAKKIHPSYKIIEVIEVKKNEKR